MTASRENVELFRSYHQSGDPFIFPNPWDAGSAVILAQLGFKALATTSSGFAKSLGRSDYDVTRDEKLAHCRQLCTAVSIPVAADLENGFGVTPEDAATTVSLAAQTGLVGGSIEDYSGSPANPILDESLAVERIEAAVASAKALPQGFVLTARAEEFLHGSTDLDSVIRRLQKFAEAGADVVYAPGLPNLAAVKTVCNAVDCPVNVLLLGDLNKHSVEEFAQAGVARISVGGGFSKIAYDAMYKAAKALKENGRLTPSV